MNALTTYDRHFGGVVTRRSASAWVPDLVAAAGPRATDAYIEFFTATIRNRNTRLAYARACYQFFHWARENGLTLDTVRPFHVAAYIEQMPGSKPTITTVRFGTDSAMTPFFCLCRALEGRPWAAHDLPDSGAPKAEDEPELPPDCVTERAFDPLISDIQDDPSVRG